jgi:hypothetical protein
MGSQFGIITLEGRNFNSENVSMKAFRGNNTINYSMMKRTRSCNEHNIGDSLASDTEK